MLGKSYQLHKSNVVRKHKRKLPEHIILLNLTNLISHAKLFSKYSVRIIVSNSRRNKYAERNKDFSPPQAKGFYKNLEVLFAFCDAILDINNISYEKQYTMDE